VDIVYCTIHLSFLKKSKCLFPTVCCFLVVL
jgi:hypothetical protein